MPETSLKNGIIVVLVIIVLVLCLGVFVIYNHDKSQSDEANKAQQSYDTLNSSYSDLSDRYTALVSSNADLNERYIALNTKYGNISSNYEALKNQSDTNTVKMGEFLADDPTVAYTYKITAKDDVNNSTMMLLTVTAYDVAKVDLNKVVVKATITSGTGNATGELVKTIDTIPSMRKQQVSWELDPTTRVTSVWVGLG